MLILCDYCERETNTYCLDPPLSAVPVQDPWYCQSCEADGEPYKEHNQDSENEYQECSEYHSIDGSDGGGLYKKRRGSVGSASVVDSQASADPDPDNLLAFQKWSGMKSHGYVRTVYECVYG